MLQGLFSDSYENWTANIAGRWRMPINCPAHSVFVLAIDDGVEYWFRIYDILGRQGLTPWNHDPAPDCEFMSHDDTIAHLLKAGLVWEVADSSSVQMGLFKEAC